jgi:hypothetical protein
MTAPSGAAKNKRNTAMMRSIAAALLATTLIAGPVFAASPAGDAGKVSTNATAGSGNSVDKPAAKPGKTAKTHHARKHVVRHNGNAHAARHVARLKTHRRHVAAHVAKPAKLEKAGKSDKS